METCDTEEPDEGNLHVRICGGLGRAIAESTWTIERRLGPAVWLILLSPPIEHGRYAVDVRMDIPEAKVATIPHFLAGIGGYPNLCWIYRGQSDASWPLLPKAGRAKFYLPELNKPETVGLPPRDICRFNYWRKLAVAYNKTLPTNEFECLAFAQHYGLATRLLDWSTNPLVALFFAVDSPSPSCGAVYCHSPGVHIDPQTAELATFPVVAQYTPPPFDSRILLQCGVFTYHSTPNQPLSVGPVSDELGPLKPDHGMDLVRFIVEPKMKPILKRQLDEIGVNRKSLFPDLEGLSEFVNWGTQRAAKSED